MIVRPDPVRGAYYKYVEDIEMNFKPQKLDVFVRRGLIFQAALVLSLLWASVGLAVTKDQAIQIANKEVHKLDKMGYVFKKWVITFDNRNIEWEKVRSFRKASPMPEARQYYEKQEAKLRGKAFIAIRYRYTPNPGIEVKDGVAWVFIEKETAKVLLVIEPG